MLSNGADMLVQVKVWQALIKRVSAMSSPQFMPPILDIAMTNSQAPVHQDQHTAGTDHTQLVLVHKEDGTATVILNRLRKRNALSMTLIASLAAALESLDQDDSVRVLLLTGPPGGPFSGKCGHSIEAVTDQ